MGLWLVWERLAHDTFYQNIMMLVYSLMYIQCTLLQAVCNGSTIQIQRVKDFTMNKKDGLLQLVYELFFILYGVSATSP